MNGRLLLMLLSCVAAGFVPPAEAEGRAVWGDWVVAGDDADTGASILLRRITPKSVFVAPTFTGCSEGYRQDSLGRCVKLVKVNQQSQWNFFLERLNSMYSPTSTSKKPQKETGPFHINLPLASEDTEESVVRKRLPSQAVQVKTTQPTQAPSTTTTTTTSTTTTSTTTTSTTTMPTTTTPQPQTSTWPTTTTTMSESTTVEVPLSTIVEPSEVTSTERDVVSSTEPTAETRRDSTTEDLDIAVMLGDQPFEGLDKEADDSLDKPKSPIQQLREKPFLIIVTNPTVTKSDTTTFSPGETSTEATTEATTDAEISEESRDATETTRPDVTVGPECYDCEPVEEISESPSSLPDLPPLDPSSQVRFPSESYVPVRKTQSYIRFPDTSPEDRPAFWWPSWQIRQYPGIHGWPESDQLSTDRVVQKKYPYGTTWSSVAWQRRFLQRD